MRIELRTVAFFVRKRIPRKIDIVGYFRYIDAYPPVAAGGQATKSADSPVDGPRARVFVEKQEAVAKRGEYDFHNPAPFWYPATYPQVRYAVETVSTESQSGK